MKTTVSRRSARLAVLIKLSWTCARLGATGQKELLPQTIYTSFRQLGGVYVKFLQLLVLRSEVFQALRAYNIYDIYDQVDTEEIAIHDVLSAELGAQAGDVVLQSEVPFAAGSFGQVYLARYRDQQVILKVLRPTIVADLKFDLRVLGFFSRCINWFSSGSAINMRQVHKDFARATTLETNYVLEADYASTLYERYRTHRNIVIPYTYRELSTARVICQDYVGGIAATELVEAASAGVDVERYVAETLGSDLKEQLVILGSEILSSAFLHGVSYGDPHPGNIKLLSDNRIGLIDYGLQAPAPRNKVTFHHLIQQYYNIYSGNPDIRGLNKLLLDMCGGDVVRAIHSLDEYYALGSSNLLDNLINSAERIMSNQREQVNYLLQNNKIMVMFNSVINKNNRFCLEYELDGPELMRAAMLFISLVTSLGVKNIVLKRSFARVLEQTKGVAMDEERPMLHPETAFEILASWFDQISYKNPQLYRQIKLQGASYV
ncbi:MAG TPA: AarF/ABC1/UbiB kinase family protein [Verrucomicrobiae bacterium]|jgi:serine/threonine protein kinase|nr:AarF/ABC1/UbiB kinase family protein [Verrucomicrobiae bacterium]